MTTVRMGERVCDYCAQRVDRADGCTEDTVVFRGGDYGRIAYCGGISFDSWSPQHNGGHCQDCGAMAGKFHHPPCDLEECPSCGKQLIGCDCFCWAPGEMT